MASDSMIEKLIDELDLLERHILMLKVTKENQPIGIIRLSEILDIPKHKVRYSLRLLEQEGLIAPSAEGATVTDKYEQYLKDVSESLEDIVDMVNRLKRELP
jgi:predicted transcriptional regulator